MSKRPDLVPQTYVIEMANLQDKVKPVPFEEMAESLDLACVCEYQTHAERSRKKVKRNLRLQEKGKQKLSSRFLIASIQIPLPAVRLRKCTKGLWKANRLL